MTDLRTPAQETALAEHVAVTREANGKPAAPPLVEHGCDECPTHGKSLRVVDCDDDLDCWWNHLECSQPGCGFEVWA